MANSDNRRAEIRKQIQETSKNTFILEEMKKLGFWENNSDKPSLPEELIKKETKLRKELNELYKKQRSFQDKDKLLRDLRKKRMKESREKQAENKRLREEARIAKKKAWEEKKKTEISYLGESVSTELNKQNSDLKKLETNQLPVFNSIEALASEMEISVNELRFLSFHRKISQTNHYQRFYMPKKSGGKRLISAPMPRLKKAQNWVLHHILYQVDLHNAAHGFVPSKSIVSNAAQHVGKDLVINLDFQNFFPTFTYKRVKGCFQALGYSAQLSTIFALLCTEPLVDEVEIDGQDYFVQKGERFLPQGAPSSPALTNILCRKLDKRLAGVAQKLNLSYSRYADDLTFSSNDGNKVDIAKLLWLVHKIVEEEGLVVHPDKTRIMRKGNRQEVTGIVVNEQLSISRKELHKFRALLFQIEKNGLKDKSWGNTSNLLSAIHGFANYLKMVNPEKHHKLIDSANLILKKHDFFSKAKPIEKDALEDLKEGVMKFFNKYF